MTGVVLKSKRMSLLIGIMVFLLTAAFASQMIMVIKSFLMERRNTKTSQAVQASVMMRVLSLPASFFRGFSSGELASRTSAVNSLCSMILNNVIVAGLTGLMSLLYITQIAQFAPVLVVPSILITLAGTAVMYFLAVKSGVNESHYYAFSAAYGRLVGAFSAISGIAVSVAGVKPVLEMAEPILKAEPETSSDKKEVSTLFGQVEMNHVSFRYEENTPYIIKDLSLKVKPGEYVAVVGRTGQLFQGDIYSNITIAAPEMTIDEAWEAAEIAGIADVIRKMPMGMHTIISEGSGGISGGQKQRLMIARAIAPKPKILIFDEATSALDNKTQKQISDALDKMNCTRIVIAHRLSTIRHCDRILMLEEGRITEEGTYEELIEKNGAFADMVARQRI